VREVALADYRPERVAGPCAHHRRTATSLIAIARVKAVEEAVKLVRDVGVIERDGMGVVPQGGGGVPVAEAGLGLQQPPLVYQVGGDAVAKAAQGRMLDARGVGWLLSETGVPRRIKTAFLTDADIADLAAYAASLRGHRSAA
jgi:hypothetical protein